MSDGIMINFMIAGAQKCGTTSLHYWLASHPGIFMPALKEMKFFSRQVYYEKGEHFLKPFYEGKNHERIVGGSDVDIIWKTEAARNVVEFNREMKLIVLLRNPVQRAYSAYRYEMQKCIETAPTFEEALRRETETPDNDGDYGYLSRGLYARQLKDIYRYFEPARIHVIFFEDLRNNPGKVVEDVLRFLGAEVRAIGPVKGENVTGMPRSVVLQKLLYDENLWYRKVWSHIVPHGLRLRVRKRLLYPLHRLNYRKVSYPHMVPETSVMLRDYFRADIIQLQEMVGRDLRGWLS